jgi:hypothetical protein
LAGAGAGLHFFINSRPGNPGLEGQGFIKNKTIHAGQSMENNCRFFGGLHHLGIYIPGHFDLHQNGSSIDDDIVAIPAGRNGFIRMEASQKRSHYIDGFYLAK